jgi:hypothetical protein
VVEHQRERRQALAAGHRAAGHGDGAGGDCLGLVAGARADGRVEGVGQEEGGADRERPDGQHGGEPARGDAETRPAGRGRWRDR